MRARRHGGFDFKRVNWPNNAQAGGLFAAVVPYTEKLLIKNESSSSCVSLAIITSGTV